MFGQTAMHMEDGKVYTACQRVTKVLLSGLTSLYSVTNFILFIMSAYAWQTAQHRSRDMANCIVGGQSCTMTRWNLYPFMTFAALIACLMSSLMALRAMSRGKSVPLDPVWLFRGMFFTLLIMTPLVFIGWTAPASAGQFPSGGDFLGKAHSCPDGSNDCTNTPILGSTTWDKLMPQHLAGLSGTFLLESADSACMCGKPAMVLMHINL